jgi:hypothetical protein
MPSSNLTLERLLAAGYFPEALPPCFRTETFGAALKSGQPIGGDFDTSTKVPSRSKCVKYNQARVGATRRQFAIPNPIHFYRLAKCFHSHWSDIEPLATASPLSLTKPLLSPGRRCFQHSVGFRERPIYRAKLRSTARYIVRADIARFFPSIYTHSISWAFHGKAVAKKNRGNSYWANQLDTCFQSIQDGQTIGIPIGQEISRVIAEVILWRVEEILDISRKTNGIRCIDDYEVGFMSEAEAETFLNRLERALSEYELALNPLKTSIQRLPQLLIDRWDSELRSFHLTSALHETIPTEAEEDDNEDVPEELASGGQDRFRHSPSRDQLINFFNKAIDLQHAFKEDAVLRFSLARLGRFKITGPSWEVYQDYLYQCALNQPETIRIVVSNLLKGRFKDGQKIDKLKLKVAIDTIVATAAPIGHASDVAWALWTALLFQIRISQRASKALAHSPDSVVGCLTCELGARNLLPKRFDYSYLKHIVMDTNSLYENQWLLSYEASRNGWLGQKPSGLLADPCFGYMVKAGVKFFENDVADKLQDKLKAIAQVSKPSFQRRIDLSDIEDDEAEEEEADNETEDTSDSEESFDLWWLRNDE